MIPRGDGRFLIGVGVDLVWVVFVGAVMFVGFAVGFTAGRVTAPKATPAQAAPARVEYAPCLEPDAARAWAGTVLDSRPPACPPTRSDSANPVVAKTTRGVRLLYWHQPTAAWREVGDPFPHAFAGTVWSWERP